MSFCGACTVMSGKCIRHLFLGNSFGWLSAVLTAVELFASLRSAVTVDLDMFYVYRGFCL